MYRIAILIFLLLTSCTTIRKTTFKIEEEHNALYKQEALLVYAVKYNKVLLTNPPCTRCYYLRGQQYTEKWEPGDTLIIENNLEDFYNLRYTKKCK
jgi:hypothetical protein